MYHISLNTKPLPKAQDTDNYLMVGKKFEIVTTLISRVWLISIYCLLKMIDISFG